MRRRVVLKMRDLKLMYDAFNDDPFDYIRASVVNKMEDLSLAFKTFRNDKSDIVRRELVIRMERFKEEQYSKSYPLAD